jgi:nicotinamide-nucleotide amidase
VSEDSPAQRTADAPSPRSGADGGKHGVRAGILVTGTEVLTGRVADRNGPWLADCLEELGVDLAHIAIVGDRREDMLAALRFMAEQGLELAITSGGLGPTADDLTAEVVAEFQGRPMVLDEALEGRIAEILRPLTKRWPNLDMEALRAGNRKQAMVPRGATILDPIGTAPGLVVAPAGGACPGGALGDREGSEVPALAVLSGREPHDAPALPILSAPTVVVLPGPPRELQPMWAAAVQTEALRAVLEGAREYRRRMLRLFGIPESEIAETLRVAEREGVELERLEITTCLRRGEVEVVTRYEPEQEAVYDAFADVVRGRHADTLFSDDGSTVDEQVAALLRGGRLPLGEPATAEAADAEAADDEAADDEAGASELGVRGRPLTIATAESCTGGLLAARLTEPAGSSEYVRGGIVAYSNEAKVAQVGVAAQTIERHGAVSQEVARALAVGALERLGADVGVGVTGIAGPGGGTDAKPVGLVWLSVVGPGGAELTRAVNLPGGRVDVRDRATTVALHLVRRLLVELVSPARSQ